jgi:hypothetical protein
MQLEFERVVMVELLIFFLILDAALIVLYFALDALLRCCGRGSPADAHASF